MGNLIPGCGCSTDLKNTGTPNGYKTFGVVVSKIIVPLMDNTGALNYIDLTLNDLGAELLAKINHADKSKRFYPYTNIHTVTKNQAEATFEEADNGEREKIKDGIKQNSFEMWSKGNHFFSKVVNGCVPFGEYEVDECGNLRGVLKGTKLYPRKVNHKSVSKMFMDKTNSTAEKIVITYDYGYLTSDASLWIIERENLNDIEPFELQGMLDVVFSNVSAPTISTISVKLNLEYGNALEKIKVLNAIASNFTVKNKATGVANVVTGITAVENTYVLTVTDNLVDATTYVIDFLKPATIGLVNGLEGRIEFTYTA